MKKKELQTRISRSLPIGETKRKPEIEVSHVHLTVRGVAQGRPHAMMAAQQSRALVYGGKGALGSAVIGYFKSNNWVSVYVP